MISSRLIVSYYPGSMMASKKSRFRNEHVFLGFGNLFRHPIMNTKKKLNLLAKIQQLNFSKLHGLPFTL